MKKDQLKEGRKGQKGRKCVHKESFMRMVAKSYKSGNKSKLEIAEQFSVTIDQVKGWVNRYSDELGEEIFIPAMTEQEQKDLFALKQQVESLKKKLDYEQMRNFALETMIDLAKTELDVDLRKNSGAKQPKA